MDQLVPQIPRLVFDGDCAFCTSVSGWLEGRLRRRYGINPELVPWQRTDLEALGTTAARAKREVLWVDSYGTISGGAQAFAEWLKFRGGAFAAVGGLMSTPAVRPLATLVYKFIAANRSHLPGGTPACALPPAGSNTAG